MLIKKFRQWKRRRMIKAGLTALRNLDYLMTKRGISRHQRKVFWRDFTKDIETRQKTFAKLENELGL